MDFSSLNQITSNTVNLAARSNDVQAVRRLLGKTNPNCVDDRGWTSLHEAAAADSYESLLEILKHPDCQPLTKDHEGCTALQVACRNSVSTNTVEALLKSTPDIANYQNNLNVTPLHIASALGRMDIMRLLLDYGAVIDEQDFDGHTALHDAAIAMQTDALKVLLNAGADADILSDLNFTALHYACYKGCLEAVKELHLFMSNLDQVTFYGDTPLMLATTGCYEKIVSLLLEIGADPHVKDFDGDMALNKALKKGHSSIFKSLLHVTKKEKINTNIIIYACKPQYFKLEILESLLCHDLGPEFFDLYDEFQVTIEEIGGLKPIYLFNSPLNSFFNVCENIYNHSTKKFQDLFNLILNRGVAVNVYDIDECPPLVYLHYSNHTKCFEEVFRILCQHDCNVDYCTTKSFILNKSKWCIPDAFIASITSNPSTLAHMLPYSLLCEPDMILKCFLEFGLLPQISKQVQEYLLFQIGVNLNKTTVETLALATLPLKHLCRLKIREILRKQMVPKHSTKHFLNMLNSLKLPNTIKDYLRYT